MKTTSKSIRHNIKLVLKLGAGFFADAYDLFVIDLVLSIIQEIAIEDPEGMGFTSAAKSLIASATSIGAVVGMILFGLIGDWLGRRTGVLITGSLVAIGSILSAICVRSETVSLVTQLAIYRTLLGVGIGGEYPLSATMASEGADAQVRGRIVAGVFSMQGVGMLFSSLLGFIVISAGASLEFTWRFLLAFGAVPAFVALYFRLKMKEQQPIAEEKGVPEGEAGTEQKNSSSRIAQCCAVMKQFKLPLIATTVSWFLLDVTFYGTGEFKHTVSNELFPENATLSPSERVASDALFGIIISAIALPGYICACIFIDKIGRWRLQVGGFIAMTIAYVAMGLALYWGAPGWLNLLIFGLTFFFTNFGPNTTTFIIPSEIYPHAVRATCHGVSAAAGKVGAITGAAGFPPAIASVGLDGVMFICAGIAAAGLVVTWALLDKTLVDQASQRPNAKAYSDIEIGTEATREQTKEPINMRGSSSITTSLPDSLT